jgi:hypothetical protein
MYIKALYSAKRLFDRNLQSLGLLLLCSFSQAVDARDYSHWYSEKELKYIQSVYGQNLKKLLFIDVFPHLTIAERKTLSSVKIKFPLKGRSAGLFEYAMHLKTGEMYISALSVKFFDDIAIALAWYEVEKRDKNKVASYLQRLSVLEHHSRAPLKALSVPAKAWQLNAYVDDMSQKTLKSGMLFILLHELSHWHFKHAPYSKLSVLQAQQQELQADAFALEVMSRMKVIPYGMVSWFMMLGLAQTDISSTHPVTSARLMAIATKLEKNPKSFISRENISTMSLHDVLQVSKEIKVISSGIQNLNR